MRGWRVLAWGVLLWGLGLGVEVSLEMRDGVASILRRPSGAEWKIVRIQSSEAPERYQGLVAFQWLRAGGVAVVGWVILAAVRRQERLDPLSCEFAGDEAGKELEDELRRRSTRRLRRRG